MSYCTRCCESPSKCICASALQTYHTTPSYTSELGCINSGILGGGGSELSLKDIKEHLHFHLAGTFKVSYHHQIHSLCMRMLFLHTFLPFVLFCFLIIQLRQVTGIYGHTQKHAANFWGMSLKCLWNARTCLFTASPATKGHELKNSYPSKCQPTKKE